jgi:AcrR family transcriptional regulator
MSRRSKEQAEETRELLVRTARHLFGNQGYAETTIADICKKANLTKGAFFHYFANKKAIFEEIWTTLEVGMDRASAAETKKVLQESDDPYAAFIAGCRIFLEYVSDPVFQQIVYIDGPAVLGIQKWMDQDAGMGMRNIGSGLKYLSQQGVIEEKGRYDLTVLIYGALQGIAKTLSYQKNTSKTTADSLFTAFEKLVRSLK